MGLNAPTSIQDVRRRWPDEAFGDESVALLALMAIKGLGLRTLTALCEASVRPSDLLLIDDKATALEVLRKHGARVEGGDGVDWIRVREQALAKAHNLAEVLARQGVSLLVRSDPRFPPRLLEASPAPQWLFVQGAIGALHVPAIAAVGTRQPSDDGRWLTSFVGAQLGYWNAATVSGLAMGIDQLVHQWSLRARVPTVAVLGTGILSDYPKGAEELRARIIDGGGALVTEYLPRETYSAENFVRRNRLQAALGKVLIPVEWNARSGTAHTVRFAMGQRRPIACLRLPDWASDRVVLPKEKGRIFSIPGQEHEFRHFVSECLRVEQSHSSDPPSGASRELGPELGPQPSLFGQP